MDEYDMVSLPDVSVVIVNLNTILYLQKSIASVAQGFQRYTTEIIVVDNGSTDGSVEYVQGLANVHLICNTENQGFARANNQALAIMRGYHAFLLNSDAFLQPNCGDMLVDFLLSHPEVGLVVPSFEYPGGRWQRSFSFFPTLWNTAIAALGIDNGKVLFYTLLDKWARSVLKPQRVDYGEGAGLLIRNTVYQSLGGLNETYFFYGEDVDYSFRAAQAGWQTWWVPHARLTHIRGGSQTQQKLQSSAAVRRQAWLLFLNLHFPPGEVRLIYILYCLHIQRMFITVLLLSKIPGAGRFIGQRVEQYRTFRDIYWSHWQDIQ